MDNLQNKKILQVLPHMGAGGVPQGCIDITRAILSDGGQAFVASAPQGHRYPELIALGATHFSLPLHSKNPLQIAYNALRLAALVQQHGIHLIHARSRAPAWSALWASQMTGIPLITTFHGTYNFTNKVKKFYNSIMVRGNRVIAISKFIQHHIETHYISSCKSENIRLIERGIDLQHFTPACISAENIIMLRQQWGVKPEQMVIVMPGRLTRWKGQKILLQALTLLSPGSFKCIFVGADQGRTHYRHELDNFIKQHKLKDDIVFYQATNNMPTVYAASDVVVHASTDPEAFGRVVAEAQAMGKPVIASNLGAPQEIIIPQETGWLFSPFSLTELVSCLTHVAQMPENQRHQLALKARSRIVSFFSFEQMARKTLDVYKELLT